MHIFSSKNVKKSYILNSLELLRDCLSQIHPQNPR
jgi:hypothetical protein